jgi:hypothetical protein
MSFIFHEGLAALDVSGVGWVSGDVMAGLAINYPPFWASLFTPPPVAAAPTSGGTLVSPITEDDPLPANRDSGVTSIDLAGDPIAGVNHQDVTFNPNSLPWLQFAR